MPPSNSATMISRIVACRVYVVTTTTTTTTLMKPPPHLPSLQALSLRPPPSQQQPSWAGGNRRAINSTTANFAPKSKKKKKGKRREGTAEEGGALATTTTTTTTETEESGIEQVVEEEQSSSAALQAGKGKVRMSSKSEMLAALEEQKIVAKKGKEAQAEDKAISISKGQGIWKSEGELVVELEEKMEKMEEYVLKLPSTQRPLENWSSSEAMQAFPLSGFYRLVLDSTPEYVNPIPFGLRNQEQLLASSSSSSSLNTAKENPSNPLPQGTPPPKPVKTIPSTSQPAVFATVATTQPKSQIAFSSRLSGPIGHRRDDAMKDRRSKVIAGVVVPPKPSEPDNCCMSGCVNCVWDIYREDLEFHTQQKKLAMAALAKLGQLRKEKEKEKETDREKERIAIATGTSMDDDGGRWVMDESELNEEGWLEDNEIPIGIRAFMSTEKKLKEQKLKAQKPDTVSVEMVHDGASVPSPNVVGVS